MEDDGFEFGGDGTDIPMSGGEEERDEEGKEEEDEKEEGKAVKGVGDEIRT